MKRSNTIILLIAMSIVALFTASAPAADKKELQARFEKRYPQILEYKSQGKVGETTQGLIEAVGSADATLSKLIDEENSDRRELYKLIAAEEKTTPDKVADLTARRNYEKARRGDFLKTADGQWKKKS